MHPDPTPDPSASPTEEEELAPRSLRRLGRRTAPTSPEHSSTPASDPSTIAGRLRIFAEQLGAMSQGSAMGAMFRMVVPRLLTDLDDITEDQLAAMLDALAERLQFVRHGEAPQAADTAPRDDDEDPAPTVDPLTTDG